MNKYLFIADFFSNQIAGGGELNNEELIKILNKNNIVVSIKSSELKNIEIYKDFRIIVGNFINLSEFVKMQLIKLKNYVIYEHDHKYLINRNPAEFTNFKAPESAIVNKKFYENAKKVLVQSIFHKNIIEKNLNINNVLSLSGNLWSEEVINILEKNTEKPKKDISAIMYSNNFIKNTEETIIYCEKQNIPYTLIPEMKYLDFLNILSDNKKFIFFPKTPETLSRVVVEARAMNMSIITNKNVGAAYEDWFSLKGKDLIVKLKQMRITIPQIVEGCFNE